MTTYEILKPFKDGRDIFEAGERRAMERERADKFARRGWVLVPGVTPDADVPQHQMLDIQNGRLGHSAETL